MLKHRIPFSLLLGILASLGGLMMLVVFFDEIVRHNINQPLNWRWEQWLFLAVSVLPLINGVLLCFRSNVVRVIFFWILHLSIPITIFLLAAEYFGRYLSFSLVAEIISLGLLSLSPQLFLLFFLSQYRFVEEFKGGEDKERDDLLDFFQ